MPTLFEIGYNISRGVDKISRRIGIGALEIRPDTAWKCPACLKAPKKILCDDCKSSYANEICWLSCSKRFEFRVNFAIVLGGFYASLFGALLGTSMWTTAAHLNSIVTALWALTVPDLINVLLADKTIRACVNLVLVVLYLCSTAVLWGSTIVILFINVVDSKRKLWKMPSSTIYFFMTVFIFIACSISDSSSEVLEILIVALPYQQGLIGLIFSLSILVSTRGRVLRKDTKEDSVSDVEQGKQS